MKQLLSGMQFPARAQRIASLVLPCIAMVSSLTAGPGQLFQTYNDPLGVTSDTLGTAVAATSSNQLIIGAPGVGNTGATYVFSASSATSQGSLAPPASGAIVQQFGSALSTNQTAIVVGDPGAVFPNPAPETSYVGGAFVYASTADANPLAIHNPLMYSWDAFGIELSLSTNGLAVGAPWYTTDTLVTKQGRAYVYPNGSAIPSLTLDNPSPLTETGFGSAVAYANDGVLSVGAPGDGQTTSGGIVYEFDASTGENLLSIPNPGSTGDCFGNHLAYVGTSIVIAAPNASTGSALGKVYIMDRATGALQQTLTNPDNTSGTTFGVSLATDSTHVFVGCLEPGAGKVYVFNASTGAPVQTLSNPSPNAGDTFGAAVAVAGTSVLIGDPESNGPGKQSRSGQAFLFGGPDAPLLPPAAPSNLAAVATTPTTIEINFTDNANNEDGFILERRVEPDATFTTLTTLGANVTTYEDTDLTPEVTYCYRVKAFNTDGESTYSEEACATTPSGIIPDLIDRIPNPGQPGDLFGFSMSFIGKTKGGKNCVVIGAPGSDTKATSAGIAYVFDPSSLFPLTYLVNPTGGAGDEFGYAVAGIGKYVFVGAPYADTDGGDAGIVYMFDGETGVLLKTFHSPSPHGGDHFGKAISAVGKTAIAVGAPGRSVEAPNSGAVFVFNIMTGAAYQTIINPFPAEEDHFGASVAGLKGNVAIAAPGADGILPDSGKAYVVSKTGKIIAQFGTGTSVGTAGSKAIVGVSELAEAGGPGDGFAFLVSGSKSKLTFGNPNPNPGDAFGFSVAGSKKLILVGAPSEESKGHQDAGQAYLYTQKSPFPLRTYINPSADQDDHFGYAGVIAGPYGLVSAPWDDTDGEDAGSVFIYNAPVK